MNATTVRFGAWFDERDLTIDFPQEWLVTTCSPDGQGDIGASGIRRALADPIGTARLGELARGKHRVVIVIDDLSRPTPSDRLVSPLLDELHGAGVAVEEITILVGTANHRTLMRPDLEKKLGRQIVERYSVHSHFSWSGCVEVGTTSRGTRIELNTEFVEADLRILVGSIVPHPVTGFSGGAKMVVPAIASAQTAIAFHTGVPIPGEGLGDVETTARRDAEEGARLVGVDFIVNAITSPDRGVAALVAGEMVAAHRHGTSLARAAYRTSAPEGADVVVLSAYPKDNELIQYTAAFAPLHSAPFPLVRPGGTVVVVTAASEGAGFHSLFSPHMIFGGAAPRSVGDAGLVLVSPGVNRGDLEAQDRDRRLFSTWALCREWLEATHGPRASVSVFPSAVHQLVDRRA